ncbi:MAG TPA: iron-sulfur cluster repair di-iron protein [Pirellulaceae bacterium]|nr:iron-sulfur cluster repair di-iron protein [Pirellulaceae bacterium]
MNAIMTPDDRVGDWVARRPATSRVFEKYGIDYCCGGKQRLGEACDRIGIDLGAVMAELAEAGTKEASTDDEPAALGLTLTQLCDSIVATHHDYLKRELPRLEGLVVKVVAAHGERHPSLVRLAELFRALVGELMPHLMKEEMILFPAIRAIDRGDEVGSFPFGTVDHPIRMMEHEHEEAGALLAELRSITHGYQLPPGGCNTYRALLDGLRELEADLHRHIHKENHLLFPLALERAMPSDGSPSAVESVR